MDYSYAGTPGFLGPGGPWEGYYWKPDGIPGADDTASFGPLQGTSYAVDITSPVTVANIDNADAQIDVGNAPSANPGQTYYQGSLVVTGTLQTSYNPSQGEEGVVAVWWGSLQVSGTVDNCGAIAINGATKTGNIQLPGQSLLLLDGAVTLEGGGILALASFAGSGEVESVPSDAGTFTNVDNTINAEGGRLGDGTFSIVNDSAGAINGGVIDTGAFTLANAGLIAGSDLQTQYVVNTGTLAYGFTFGSAADDTLTLSGGGTVALSYGYHGGQGSIAGDVVGAQLVNIDNTINCAGEIGVNGSIGLDNQSSGLIDANYGALYVQTGTNTLSNEGVIEAITNGALTIQNSADVINTGTIEATGAITPGFVSATLNLDDIIDNTGGTIAAATAGVTLELTGEYTAISHGTLSDVVGSQIDITGEATITGVDFANAGAMNLNGDSGQLDLNANLDNSGTFAVDDLLQIGGDVTLSGGGSLTLNADGGGSGFVQGLSASDTLTNVDNTISGAGYFGDDELSIDNQLNATIESNIANDVLFLDMGAGFLTNEGTLAAVDNSTLAIGADGHPSAIPEVTNSGIIEALDTSDVGIAEADVTQTSGGIYEALGVGSSIGVTDFATLTGGTVSTVAGAYLTLSHATLDSTIDNAGSFTLAALSDLGGSLDNAGTVTLYTSPTDDAYIDANNLTLSGNGQFQMNGGNLQGAASSDQLVNTGNTIMGPGDLGVGSLTLDNQSGGTIQAQGGALTIDTGAGAFTNEGLLEAIAGGSLVINSTLDNTGELEADGGAITVNAAVTGDGSVVLANGGSADFESSFDENVAFQDASTLTLSESYAGTISGFSAGDIIDLKNLAFDPAASSYTVAAGSGPDDYLVTFQEGTASFSIQFEQSTPVTSSEFLPIADSGTGTEITVACYCPGTMILTENGERPVEALSIGDHLPTLHGGPQAIKWIGRRSYAGRFIAGQPLMLPVCVKRGAIEHNVPSRDLWLSPGHAIHVDGALVPAWLLVNGVSITQAETVESVSYIHVELADHEVIFADNCPAESFFDDDCRGQFANAAEFRALYPDHQKGRLCAPRIEDWFGLQAIQRRLAARVGVKLSFEQSGALRGFVDEAGPRVVAGWAQNEAHPEAPVCLDIRVDGERISRVLANRYRADLRAAGIGGGKHGFVTRLPEGI